MEVVAGYCVESNPVVVKTVSGLILVANTSFIIAVAGFKKGPPELRFVGDLCVGCRTSIHTAFRNPWGLLSAAIEASFMAFVLYSQ